MSAWAAFGTGILVGIVVAFVGAEIVTRWLFAAWDE